MFYPVRIYNSKGKIIKELSTKQLNKIYWKKFFEPLPKNLEIKPGNRSRRKKEDYLPEDYDNYFFSEE